MTDISNSGDVETRFVEQLGNIGWEVTAGDPSDPKATGRDDFREVLLLDDLRAALRRINKGGDDPSGLSECDVDVAVDFLRDSKESTLFDSQQRLGTLLCHGTEFEDADLSSAQKRGCSLQFIDWNHRDNNTFRVINQFRVDEGEGDSARSITVDIVLFLNGIPLVVVTCVSPGANRSMEAAIDEVLAEAQRTPVEPGRLHFYGLAQFAIVTCWNDVRVGSLVSSSRHFTVPGMKKRLHQRQLIEGMLRPEYFIELMGDIHQLGLLQIWVRKWKIKLKRLKSWLFD